MELKAFARSDQEEMRYRWSCIANGNRHARFSLVSKGCLSMVRPSNMAPAIHFLIMWWREYPNRICEQEMQKLYGLSERACVPWRHAAQPDNSGELWEWMLKTNFPEMTPQGFLHILAEDERSQSS